MAKYHVKMDGSDLQMTKLSPEQEKLKKSKVHPVTVKLSKNVLAKMKQVAGVKQGTDNQILHAYITKTLQDA